MKYLLFFNDETDVKAAVLAAANWMIIFLTDVLTSNQFSQAEMSPRLQTHHFLGSLCDFSCMSHTVPVVFECLKKKSCKDETAWTKYSLKICKTRWRPYGESQC